MKWTGSEASRPRAGGFAARVALLPFLLAASVPATASGEGAATNAPDGKAQAAMAPLAVPGGASTDVGTTVGPDDASSDEVGSGWNAHSEAPVSGGAADAAGTDSGPSADRKGDSGSRDGSSAAGKGGARYLLVPVPDGEPLPDALRNYLAELHAPPTYLSLTGGGLSLQTPALETRSPGEELSPDGPGAEPGKYHRYVENLRQSWSNLIPTHASLQYAGSMGLMSLGIGWEYGYWGGFRHLSTQFQVGFLPKFDDSHARWTLTLKQDMYPWYVSLGGGFYFVPFSAGMYFTFITGEDYWVSEPDKYPGGYYWFSTRMRFNMYVGEAVTWVIPDEDRRFAASLSLFYELGVNDFGVLNYVSNSYLGLRDVVHLSLGLRVQWL